MEVRKGYKQTEIGIIPEDWDVGILEKYCFIIDCKHITADFIENGIPVASIREVQSRFVDLENAKQTTQAYYSHLIEGGRKPQVGDLIFSRNATVGETAQVANWHPVFAVGQDVCIIRKKISDYSSDYIQDVIRSGIVIKQLSNLMAGSTFKRINVQQIKNFIVPMPKAKEQEAIAEALSDADALIESLETLLAKKRQVKQGAMSELLTGKRRLVKSGEWKVKRLGDIAHIQTGGRNNQDKIEDGEYPFFVRSAIVERINSYSYDCEAILIPGEGNIGSIFHYINGRFDVHQRVYAITQFQNEVSGKFVYLYMTQFFGKHALKNTVKATVDSLRLPTFVNFEVSLPPTLAEQTAIAEILSDMDAEIRAVEEKLSKARAVKAGMMSELLGGRIRLNHD